MSRPTGVFKRKPVSYDGFDNPRVADDFFSNVSKAALFDVAYHLANIVTGTGVDTGSSEDVLDRMQQELYLLQIQGCANPSSWKPTLQQTEKWTA